MASSYPVRAASMFAFVVISASALFGCTTGTASNATSSEVVVLRYEDPYVTPAPPVVFADIERELALFSKAPRLPRFPLPLVAVPVERAELVAGSGPGRCSVTPGRTACERQTVPARSRRKQRTWERDAAA